LKLPVRAEADDGGEERARAGMAAHGVHPCDGEERLEDVKEGDERAEDLLREASHVVHEGAAVEQGQNDGEEGGPQALPHAGG